MKLNAAAHMTSATGEIFSRGATAANDEKIAVPPANTPVMARDMAGNVTLISKSNFPCHTAEKTQDAKFTDDLQHLTAMQLRRKYPAEANSHRNMLTRSKQRGCKVHPAFRQFRHFLQLVGPLPVSGATLDRIDNADREYAPGKVRWADKRTQNNNKGDTLTFHDQVTDKIFTASQLAKLQRVCKSTIRKRVERGWSDAEIIQGVRAATIPAVNEKLSSHSLSQAGTRKCVSGEPPRSRSAREIQFEAMAREFAEARARGEEEPLPAPHYVINKELELVGDQRVKRQHWLRKFARHWPEYRPHLNFERATPFHQWAIGQIDPKYVEREREKIRNRSKLAREI